MRKVIVGLVIGLLIGSAVTSYAYPVSAWWAKISTAISNVRTQRTAWDAIDTEDWGDAKVKERIQILRDELTQVEIVLFNLHGRVKNEAEGIIP